MTAPSGAVDLHTHLAPRLAGSVDGVQPSAGRLVVDGREIGPDALYDAARLVAHLDRAGLDTAVVSLPPPFYRQHLDAVGGAAWAHAANDGIATAVAGQPRLVPLAYLPLEHPATAMAEYERIRAQPGWAGVTACAGARSVSLADPRLAPLWEALAADGRLLLLHPGTSPDHRLGDFYLENLLGNPVETALAAAQLLLGGVLTARPGVRVLLTHCGGAVPALVGRWQRGVDTARPGLAGRAVEPPVDACRSFFVDCLAHHPAVLDFAVELFGADRIVLGSDWPFPMGTDDPRALVGHRGAAFVDQVAVHNAHRALGR